MPAQGLGIRRCRWRLILADIGVESTTAVITTTGDETATIAEVEVFIERAETEGITTVALLGEGEFRFIGLPLKWRGGTGSPIRAVAVFDF